MPKWKDYWTDKGQFKIHKRTGYRINRVMIQVLTVVALLYLSFSMYWTVTHDKYYIVCEEGGCNNPLYGEDCARMRVPGYLCDMEYFSEGFTAGYDIPSPIKDAPVYALLMFGLAFFINHVSFNVKDKEEDDV